VGYGALSVSLSAPQPSPRGRKPLSAQTTRTVSGAPHHPPARHQRHPYFSSLPQPPLRLATGPRHRATSDTAPLSSSGLPPILALDLPAWAASDAQGLARPHLAYGTGKPDVGAGTHRQ